MTSAATTCVSLLAHQHHLLSTFVLLASHGLFRVSLLQPFYHRSLHHPSQFEVMKAEKPISLVDFPPEMVNEILHYGCILSTSFCLALCQISSWTRKLALPYLYSTVVIKKHSSNQSLLLALTPKFTPICSPSPQFSLKDCIENLWVKAVSNKIVTLFHSCPNLRNIALPPDNTLWLAYASSHSHIASYGLWEKAKSSSTSHRILQRILAGPVSPSKHSPQ